MILNLLLLNNPGSPTTEKVIPRKIVPSLTRTRSTRWGRPATSTKYTTSLRWLSARVPVTTTTTKIQPSFVLLLLLAARCAFAVLLWCLLDKDKEKILPVEINVSIWSRVLILIENKMAEKKWTSISFGITQKKASPHSLVFHFSWANHPQ